MFQSLLTIIEIKIGIRITHQGPPRSFVSQQLQKKKKKRENDAEINIIWHARPKRRSISYIQVKH